MEEATKKTQSKHYNWSSIAKRKYRNCSHELLPKRLVGDQEDATQSDRLFLPLGVMEKSENGLCLTIENRNSFDGLDPQQIVMKVLLLECLESWQDRCRCWDLTFPEDGLCSLKVMTPKVVGASCLAKFRPEAGLCAMRKFLGYVWLKSPPLKYESVQTAFVPKTHADVGLFLCCKLQNCRENGRETLLWYSGT